MKTKTKNQTPYKKGRATKKTGGNIASGYQIQKEFLSLFEYEKFRAQMMSTVECNLQLAVFFSVAHTHKVNLVAVAAVIISLARLGAPIKT